MQQKPTTELKTASRRYNVPVILAAFVGFWVPIVIFARLAGEVIEREPIALDVAILQWIHSYANTTLDAFFIFLSTIGGVEVIAPLVVLASAYFFYHRYRRRSVILLFGVGGAAAANLILKGLFDRERPSLWHQLVTEHSFSFPSGHAMASSALAISVILILWRTRWRWWAVAGGVLFAGLVSLSRLYLGVHYPTDIVAGWCASAVWVLIVGSLVDNFPFSLRTRAARLLKKK